MQPPTIIHNHPKKAKLVTNIYLDCTIRIITEYISDTETSMQQQNTKQQPLRGSS